MLECLTNPKFPTAIRIVSFVFKLILFVIFVWMAVRLIVPDNTPVNDSDLLLPERSVDPAQNPFPEIRNSFLTEEDKSDLKRVDLMNRGKEDLDERFVGSMLEKFARELSLFDKFATMTEWKVVGGYRKFGLDDYLNSIRLIAPLKRSEILRQFDQRDTATAIEKAFLMMQFGQRMEDCDGTLSHYFVGNMIIGIAHETIVQMVDRVELDLNELELLAKRLDQFEIRAKGLGNALRVEHQINCSNFENLAAGDIDFHGVNEGKSLVRKIGLKLLFRVNQTKQLQADMFRSMIDEVPMVRENASHAASKRAEKIQKNKIKWFLGENPMGGIIGYDNGSSIRKSSQHSSKDTRATQPCSTSNRDGTLSIKEGQLAF